MFDESRQTQYVEKAWAVFGSSPLERLGEALPGIFGVFE